MLRTDRRIEAIDFDDGRMIIMLRPGFRVGDEGNDTDRCHTFGADTHAEIRRTLKDEVVRCGCDDCRQALAGSGRLWS